MPFVVALNHFEGAEPHSTDDVRDALTISDEVPVLVCDARVRASAKSVLVGLVEHAIATLVGRA